MSLRNGFFKLRNQRITLNRFQNQWPFLDFKSFGMIRTSESFEKGLSNLLHSFGSSSSQFNTLIGYYSNCFSKPSLNWSITNNSYSSGSQGHVKALYVTFLRPDYITLKSSSSKESLISSVGGRKSLGANMHSRKRFFDDSASMFGRFSKAISAENIL